MKTTPGIVTNVKCPSKLPDPIVPIIPGNEIVGRIRKVADEKREVIENTIRVYSAACGYKQIQARKIHAQRR